MTMVADDYNAQKKAGFIARNPVAVFFVLACVLSLGAFLFMSGYPVVKDTFESLGVPFRTTLVLTIQILQANPDTWFGILGFIYHPFTPTIAALIVVGYLGGWNAIRELLSRLRPWQPNIRPADGLRIWLIAIATMIAVTGSSALICFVFAEPGQFTWTPGQFGWLPVWAWFLAGLFTDGGGVGEELGWRGFGSSFLQAKYAPLKAAIYLGLLWTFWHFPDRIPALFEDPLSWIYNQSFFTINTVCGTIVMVYFSNQLGGSALIGVTIHSQMNDSFNMRGVLLDTSANLNLGAISGTLPIVIAAAVIIYISKGQLSFNKANPGRQVWTWPSRGSGLSRNLGQ
jgi:uncharacterized protein